jgi:anti-sigma regulatory factor (Ser/Thr protein kinase)
MFPTVNGVAVVNPKMISENSYIPKVIIQSIEADDVSQNIYDSIITINNDTRKLEINFTAPFFGDSKNLLFEYKLEGYDVEWHQPDNSRAVSYSNLPPGDYVFKIGIYGYVDEQKIIIRIPSPFWKTGKFYILLAIFCTLVFFTIVYFRTKKIRKKAELNTEINKQYAALELKALQGQMNPHFMFNCLNTIKYFITTDNKTAANKYLGKFSKLIRLFLEHANSNTIPLSEEIHILSLYIEMEQLRLDNSFDFQLNVDPRINLKETEIPAMLLQPFVENAIHHGLRNHIKKGVLTLSIIFENDLLKIIIDDNGVGRKKSAELKQFSAKEHTSMGMKLTEERIETLNYIKNTHITLEIIDKVDTQEEQQGTRIIITIPNNN